MSTEEKTSQLIINKLTKEQFEAIETPSETELYLTPDESIQVGDNVSVLVNDAGYQTASDVEAVVSGKITGKQDTIADLDTIRSGAALGATALQTYTETDPTVPAHVKAITAENIAAWNNKSSFSGNYEDLTNKPTIPTVPSVVSAFENDAGYVTNEYHDSTKQDVIEDLATIRSGAALGATALQSYTESDPTVPAHVKAITEENITAWNNKSSFSGSYEDLTNKPTIPTVNNNTIIIKQGDEIKGTFTLNQGEDYTVELDVGGSGTTAASQFGEINGTTTTSTTELDLGRTVKKSQMVGLNVGNTLVLPELYSLSTDGTKIILQNAIGANVMWSVVYVKALNVAELQEATSETSGVVKIDSIPTAGSTNAITSGAVYAALQEIKDTLSQLNSGN